MSSDPGEEKDTREAPTLVVLKTLDERFKLERKIGQYANALAKLCNRKLTPAKSAVDAGKREVRLRPPTPL